jgi:ubiquinone/menaquinone biosynthesis C-methylase UbiE
LADSYAGFAERYDWFFDSFTTHEASEVDFFRRLFAQSGVHRVLDCACGTGRHVHMLHELGCQIHGSDISDSMLSVARKNLQSSGVDVPLCKLDYRLLPEHYKEPFDAVVCLSTSISHMPDESQVERAFRSMRAVLRDDGILVLTQGTSDRQWNEKPRFILAVDKPEFSRTFVIDYLQKGARYSVLDILRNGSTSELKVWSAEYALILLQEDQRRLLTAAGFSRIDFYGGFDFQPYDRELSPRLIAVAHK